MRPFRFHRAASVEYRNAIDWYLEHSYAAASGFVETVLEGIAQIRAFPLAWPTWRGRPDLHVRTLRRYPYSLVYYLQRPDPGEIIILAVAHQRRRLGYWTPRLRRL